MTVSPHAIQAPNHIEDRAPFLALAGDEVTRGALLKIAAGHGWPGESVSAGGVIEAVRILSAVPTPRLLVIDLSGSSEPMEDAATLAEVCDQGTRLIALGGLNDVELFRGLMDLGVQDYLLKPVSPAALAAAIERAASKPDAAAEEAKPGRLVCVIGARGGAGASSIAVNTAWIIAEEQGRRTALVDLDLYFGTLALSLDLEPGRGFREALENPSRIDGLFVERAMVRATEKLFVLAAEERLENPFAFDPAALDLLLAKLRRNFECVVVDLPRTAASSQGAVIGLADAVAVVSDPSLAGMRDALRLADFARTAAPDALVEVVLNQLGGEKAGALSLNDFERCAGIKVGHAIPYARKEALKSAAAGQALAEVAGGGKLKQALRLLARELSGGEDPFSGMPLWRRLLRGVG